MTAKIPEKFYHTMVEKPLCAAPVSRARRQCSSSFASDEAASFINGVIYVCIGGIVVGT